MLVRFKTLDLTSLVSLIYGPGLPHHRTQLYIQLSCTCSLESPKIKYPQLRRERAESEISAQMDPDDIDHFTHPQSSELYTVVQKSVKDKTKRDEVIAQPEEKPPPPPKKILKPHKATSNDSLFSLLDRSDRRVPDSSPSTPNLGVVKTVKPPRPPPPSGERKAGSQLVHRPLPRIPPSR